MSSTQQTSRDLTEAVTTDRAGQPVFRLARLRDFTLVPAIVVLLVVGALISPVFLSSGNLINVLQQQTELSRSRCASPSAC